MPKYEVLRAAKSDLHEIALFTLENWGEEQAIRYISGLRDSFQLLAMTPGLGRACKNVIPGLRRFEVRKHVVFFLRSQESVLIVRVLHQQMLPSKSRFERHGAE